jgi:hypothetical protein
VVSQPHLTDDMADQKKKETLKALLDRAKKADSGLAAKLEQIKQTVAKLPECPPDVDAMKARKKLCDTESSADCKLAEHIDEFSTKFNELAEDFAAAQRELRGRSDPPQSVLRAHRNTQWHGDYADGASGSTHYADDDLHAPRGLTALGRRSTGVHPGDIRRASRDGTGGLHNYPMPGTADVDDDDMSGDYEGPFGSSRPTARQPNKPRADARRVRNDAQVDFSDDLNTEERGGLYSTTPLTAVPSGQDDDHNDRVGSLVSTDDEEENKLSDDEKDKVRLVYSVVQNKVVAVSQNDAERLQGFVDVLLSPATQLIPLKAFYENFMKASYEIFYNADNSPVKRDDKEQAVFWQKQYGVDDAVRAANKLLNPNQPRSARPDVSDEDGGEVTATVEKDDAEAGQHTVAAPAAIPPPPVPGGQPPPPAPEVKPPPPAPGMGAPPPAPGMGAPPPAPGMGAPLPDAAATKRGTSQSSRAGPEECPMNEPPFTTMRENYSSNVEDLKTLFEKAQVDTKNSEEENKALIKTAWEMERGKSSIANRYKSFSESGAPKWQGDKETCNSFGLKAGTYDINYAKFVHDVLNALEGKPVIPEPKRWTKAYFIALELAVKAAKTGKMKEFTWPKSSTQNPAGSALKTPPAGIAGYKRKAEIVHNKVIAKQTADAHKELYEALKAKDEKKLNNDMLKSLFTNAYEAYMLPALKSLGFDVPKKTNKNAKTFTQKLEEAFQGVLTMKGGASGDGDDDDDDDDEGDSVGGGSESEEDEDGDEDEDEDDEQGVEEQGGGGAKRPHVWYEPSVRRLLMSLLLHDRRAGVAECLARLQSDDVAQYLVPCLGRDRELVRQCKAAKLRRLVMTLHPILMPSS